MANFKALQLHSPAGVEPMSYTWPLRSGSGADIHDNGLDIMDTIKWVCDDVPEIKAALEDLRMHEIDTGSYEAMYDMCDLYNRAIDSVTALVSIHHAQ